MSEMYFLPFRPAFDSAGVSVPGSQHWFTLAGTNTPSAAFTDATLTVHLANPVVANGIGYLPPVYLDPGISYRVRIYDADAEVGVDVPLEEYDPYVPALAGADVLSALAANTGATLVKDSSGNTLQAELDKLLGKALGTLPSGSTNSLDVNRTASAAADGTTQWYGDVDRIHAQGANNWDHVRESYAGVHGDGTGTIANFTGRHQYIWLTTNTVTAGKVYEGHVRLDGPGSITGEADYFRCGQVNVDGGSTIFQCVGFSCGNIGNATQITNVYGVDIADFSASAIAIGVRTQTNAGTNKYAFFGGGTAQSAFGGFVCVGAAASAVYPLDVRAGTAWGNVTADFSNAHATSPYGLRVRYTAVAPNNSSNEFIVCSDTVGNKFVVTSSGTVTAAGPIISSGGKVGYTAGAGGTVTQATSKSTGVTLDKMSGQITMNNAALAANTAVSFLVSNSAYASVDGVIITLAAGHATKGTYNYWVDGTGGGAFWITVKNISAGSLSEALVLNFTIMRGSTT